MKKIIITNTRALASAEANKKFKEESKQKCAYYNRRMKCAFFGQEKCVYDNGMIPFPYSCGVEERAEAEAMREPDK